MKKIKPLVFVVGGFAFLMVFLFGRKAYGNMTKLVDMPDIAIEGSETATEEAERKEPAEEKDGLGDEKMNEPITDSGIAIDTVINTKTESSESVEEKVEYVDEKMNEALTSDKYSKMSLAERRELASDILLQLEQDGYISGVLYSEDGFMYSFEYSDGTLGGWFIKDFSAQESVLPMN